MLKMDYKQLSISLCGILSIEVLKTIKDIMPIAVESCQLVIGILTILYMIKKIKQNKNGQNK